MYEKNSTSTKTLFLLVLFSFFGFSCVEVEDEAFPETGTLELALVQTCSDSPRTKANRDPDGSGGCCGDNFCDTDERYTCPSDCSPSTYCGDGSCNGSETPSSCSRDCGTCGNNRCDAGETANSCARDCALPTRVRVDRVRYCRNGTIFCNSATTYSEYRFWSDAGVTKNHQVKTYLAKLSEPPRNQVEHLVFVAAGQQDGLNDSSRITGQPTNYKSGFRIKDKSKWVNINRGLAHEVVDELSWPIQNTFAAAAFDARFNFEFSKYEKGDIVDAHYRWLRSKFDSNKIKSIYLGGLSRGGCLAARLGSRFVKDFPNVTVIVHSFDGVCSQRGSFFAGQEFGVTSTRIDNPVHTGDGRAFSVDLFQQFSNRANLSFYNQISGARVIAISGARAFSHSAATAREYNSGGARPWLTQEWHNESHTGMDQEFYRGTAIAHLVEQCRIPTDPASADKLTCR